MEAVEAPGPDNAGEYADKGIGDPGKGKRFPCVLRKPRNQRLHRIHAEQCRDHQPGNQCGKAADAVASVRHPDPHPDSKEQRNLIHQRSARPDEKKPDLGGQPFHGASLHGSGTEQIAQPHQEAADRQAGNREHQGLS